MAFADSRRMRPNAASIGGALLINGLAVAGIFYAVPEAFLPEWGETVLITIAKPEPAKPEPRRPEEPHKPTAAPKSLPFDPPPIAFPPADPIQIKTEFKLQPIGEGFGEGVGAKPIDPPSHIAQTGARIDPRYAAYLQPAYPLGAMRQNLEGSATVRVLVGADGRVKAVEPVRFSDESFLNATREQALRKWRFVPATRDGAPIESWREMTVRFEMPG